MLDAVCISLWEGTSHDLQSKVHECINILLFVFLQGRAVKTSLLAPLLLIQNIETQKCVFGCVYVYGCVYEAGQPSFIS